MSRKKIDTNVRHCATKLAEEKGFISPVDLLIKMDRIKVKQVEDWRFKRIPYLEKVILGNLGNLNQILNALQKFAQDHGFKASTTVYKSWGKGQKKQLQFSKTANPYLEKKYATHYVQAKRDAAEL